jgi:hypothetical protein
VEKIIPLGVFGNTKLCVVCPMGFHSHLLAVPPRQNAVFCPRLVISEERHQTVDAFLVLTTRVREPKGLRQTEVGARHCRDVRGPDDLFGKVKAAFDPSGLASYSQKLVTAGRVEGGVSWGCSRLHFSSKGVIRRVRC